VNATETNVDPDVRRIEAMSYADLLAMTPADVRGNKTAAGGAVAVGEGGCVPALSEAARELRAARIKAEGPQLWRLAEFAQFSGLSRSAPVKWRDAHLSSDGCPGAGHPASECRGRVDESAMPHDDATPPGSRTPFWQGTTGWQYLEQSERVDRDLFSTGGRKSPGRPPLPRQQH
jgi:hypothetical protein